MSISIVIRLWLVITVDSFGQGWDVFECPRMDERNVLSDGANGCLWSIGMKYKMNDVHFIETNDQMCF